MSYLQNAFAPVIQVLVGLYLILAVLRFLFPLCRVDFYNPLSRLVDRLTAAPLAFIGRFVPGGGVDMATVVLMLAVAVLKTALLLAVLGLPVRPSAVAVLAAGETLNIVTWTLTIAILASVVLSWVAPRTGHPAAQIVRQLAEPVLAPFRRLLPTFGGLDLSPVLALLALNLVLNLVVRPVSDFGNALLY